MRGNREMNMGVDPDGNQEQIINERLLGNSMEGFSWAFILNITLQFLSVNFLL